jgi:hypothetical protein
VYHAGSPRIKRQYTICNALIPEVYDKLLDLAETQEVPEDLDKWLDSKSNKGMYLTAKNYETFTGVATRLHEVG